METWPFNSKRNYMTPFCSHFLQHNLNIHVNYLHSITDIHFAFMRHSIGFKYACGGKKSTHTCVQVLYQPKMWSNSLILSWLTWVILKSTGHPVSWSPNGQLNVFFPSWLYYLQQLQIAEWTVIKVCTTHRTANFHYFYSVQKPHQ